MHRTDGCFKAQHLAFASYELCELNPVPRALYTHYCHSCWPRSAPSAEVQDESGDDSTESSTSTESSRSAGSA